MIHEVPWQHLLLAFAISFIAIGLRGFQHKNVIGNHRRLVFVTSIAMTLFEVASVGMIVKNGWAVALPLGLGSGFGMLTSMWMHDRFVKKKE